MFFPQSALIESSYCGNMTKHREIGANSQHYKNQANLEGLVFGCNFLVAIGTFFSSLTVNDNYEKSMINFEAWRNRYYPWRSVKKIRTTEETLLNCPWFHDLDNVLGCNFQAKDLYSGVTPVVGYDTSNVLHVGSLVPLLMLLVAVKDIKQNLIVVSLNDIEAQCVRGVSAAESDDNIAQIRLVIQNLLNHFNYVNSTNIKVEFVVRSKKAELWKYISAAVASDDFDNTFRKYYGNVDARSMLATIVMAGEFLRLSKERPILTIYGYEELVHLKFISEIIAHKTTSLYYCTYLPIVSLSHKRQKMSKSINDSGVFLKKDIVLSPSKTAELAEKEGVRQFMKIWKYIFHNFSNPGDYSIADVLNILTK